jgi:hypothetical protein
MSLSSQDLERISNGDYSFDFLKIHLIQMKAESPVEYSGSGSVSYSEDGSLQLKMYHLYSDHNQGFQDFANTFGKRHTPGKIISKEHYFAMRAFDVRGNEWRADYLWINGDLSMPAIGRVITAKITSITSESQVPNSASLSLLVLAHGKMELPWNSYEESNSHIALSKFEVRKEGFSGAVRKVDDNTIQITSTLDGKYANETSAKLFLESIGIAVGQYIRPVVQINVLNTQKTITVFSRRPHLEAKSVSQPFPTRAPHHAEHLGVFIESYLNSISEAYSPFFGYWYRILDATDSEIENKALVITTAIEGVLKTYFSTFGQPDSEFIKEATDAKPCVKLLSIGKRIKERILNSVGQASGFTAKNALHNLQKSGLVSSEMIKAWSALRNKCAHADQLRSSDLETQLVLDQTFSCIGIFFTLLFSKTNYRGTYIEYSKEGWPEGVFANVITNHSTGPAQEAAQAG